MATHTTGDSAVKTVSLDTELYRKAVDRAERLGFRSFSGYVQTLIAADVGMSGDMVLSEGEPPRMMPPSKPQGPYKIRGKIRQLKTGSKST